MINAIIQGIFNLVMMLFSIITTPILNFVFTLFPDLATFFSYITDFINTADTYLGAVCGLVLITPQMFQALFDFFIIKYTIFLGIRGYKLFVNIYNKFKV